MKVKYIKM